MKITLRNWKNDRFPVEIPDDTEYISGMIVSGDMVMEYPFYFDADVFGDRNISFPDGSFKIERKDFSKLDADDFDIYDLVF